jgi:hypothetical protein
MWRVTMSSVTCSRISAMTSSTSTARMMSRRCSKIDLALVVQYVVEFEQVLADFEVARLDLLLRLFERFVDPGMRNGFAFFEAEPLQDRVHALRTEDTHQIILQAQKEFGGAGIALAPRPAAQLIVDTPALVALGAENEKTAAAMTRFLSSATFGADIVRPARFFVRILDVGKLELDAHVGIAAELNVGAAARHVGSDSHRARTARLRDDISFLLMVARIQHVMRNGIGLRRNRDQIIADFLERFRLRVLAEFFDLLK